ncbi:MAG: hypothetical protein LBL73_07105 [Synergistaceae bacterium]|jgi:hypothetical protein|nr:hypothetical protein [Synergistaceae bacterium]
MDEDITFRVKEQEYSAGKLDARRQFHIVRRLAPFLGGILEAGNLEKLSDEKAIAGLLGAAGTIPDEQLDYVIDNCLSVVTRKDGAIWAAITAAAPGGKRVLQYKDIDWVAMLTIVYYVIKRNLSGFFDALPSDLSEKLRGMASATQT